MGGPIVAALIASRFEVIAFDPVPGRAANSGATPAGSAREVGEVSDILVTVLPGAKELESGVFAALEALPRDSLWIDLTSSDPRTVSRLAASAHDRGIEVVGAPMGGGVTAAVNRELRLFVGGSTTAIERATPVLSTIGAIEVVGQDVTSGYAAKLLANLLWFGQAIAVTEALLLGRALGLDPRRLRETLAPSAGGSVFIDEYLDNLLEGDYLTDFGIDRCVEELDILASLARDHHVPFELSELVGQLHREALGRFGRVGGELLGARLLEDRAGRRLGD
jgi:3-hydroxyisobutyrate dehydrogenase-like beta-hydroxyacid dehydrogenase